MTEKTITISSVGDLMICDSPLYAGVGVKSKYKKNRTNLIKTCNKAFNGSDLVIGNLETVVYNPRNSSLSEVQMSCPESVIADLKSMGFSVLNIANNHILQHGSKGFNNTISSCLKNGIHPIGIKDEKPLIFKLKGRLFALLSLCIHLEWYQPSNILYENSITRIINEVKRLRNKDDSVVIIVNIHWGDEYAMYPSNSQIALAHRLVDLGANVILGHHSHVLQGIEKYKGAVIAYSQGNYISDMISDICRQTGVLKIIVDSDSISFKFESAYISDCYIPHSVKRNMIKEKDAILNLAISGKLSDDDYWRDVNKNHRVGHNAFKAYFKKNVIKYSPLVAAKMIIEFLLRKIKRIRGTSSDGRVSSMDSLIYDALKQD